MSKKFDVYKWRRDHLLTENELKGTWVNKEVKIDDKTTYDGYFKTTFPMKDSEIEAAMEAKDYTYVDFERWDGDGDRKTEYWYYFLEKKKK